MKKGGTQRLCINHLGDVKATCTVFMKHYCMVWAITTTKEKIIVTKLRVVLRDDTGRSINTWVVYIICGMGMTIFLL